MQVSAVINYKGGVGKTTLTGNLAQALALCGFRVLAIDNDPQHSLSSMLGAGLCSPSIRDVYRAPAADVVATLYRAIRRTTVGKLHVITADRALSVRDAPDALFLRTAFERASLTRHYDYVLIDNAPGMELAQLCAVHAADQLLVPVELRQFALDAAVELRRSLEVHLGMSTPPMKIVANFYRNNQRENAFLFALRTLFPNRVAQTAIPFDPLFDELITQRRILFAHRLTSKAAAYYLKLVHELFDINEDELWRQLKATAPKGPVAKRRGRTAKGQA
jgi:chromosome partitioning protein